MKMEATMLNDCFPEMKLSKILPQICEAWWARRQDLASKW